MQSRHEFKKPQQLGFRIPLIELIFLVLLEQITAQTVSISTPVQCAFLKLEKPVWNFATNFQILHSQKAMSVLDRSCLIIVNSLL